MNTDLQQLAQETATKALKWVESDSDPFLPDDYKQVEKFILSALEKAVAQAQEMANSIIRDYDKRIKELQQQPKAEPWTLESVKRLYWKSGLGGIRDAHNAAIGVKQ
jgi:cob(I)alamin adenosyltransferase